MFFGVPGVLFLGYPACFWGTVGAFWGTLGASECAYFGCFKHFLVFGVPGVLFWGTLRAFGVPWVLFGVPWVLFLGRPKA